MNIPKNHHYVPQLYLTRFTSDGMLWLYDRRRQAFRHDQPKNVAAERFYYAITKDDGSRDLSVERALADLEGLIPPILDRLEEGKTPDPKDRVLLSFFLGLLYCRGLRHEREMNEMLTGYSREMLLHQSRLSTEAMSAEMQAYVESDAFGLCFDRSFLAGSVLPAGRELGGLIFCSTWTILHAEKGYAFATSDVPFGSLDPPNSEPVGIASEGVAKVFPVSPRTALKFGGSEMEFTRSKVRAGEIRRINQAVARESEVFVFARDERQLRRLVSTAGVVAAVPLTQMVVEHLPHPSGDPDKTIAITLRVPRESSED